MVTKPGQINGKMKCHGHHTLTMRRTHQSLPPRNLFSVLLSNPVSPGIGLKGNWRLNFGRDDILNYVLYFDIDIATALQLSFFLVVSKEITAVLKQNKQFTLAWNFLCLFIFYFLVFYFDTCLSGARFPVKLGQTPLINKCERHREIVGYFHKLFQIVRSLARMLQFT